jgi:transposase
VGVDRAVAATTATASPLAGRWIDDRLVLSGILFVLTTGIAWQRLPQELGFGSGMTCWRRLRDWHQAGVFARLHQLLLARLRQNDQLDLSRAVCDSASLRTLLGAPRPAPAQLIALGP